VGDVMEGIPYSEIEKRKDVNAKMQHYFLFNEYNV
jgi:hypothetical protein